jgi:hypothetical protein
MKYKKGDKVVCISLEREKERTNSIIKLHEIYTVYSDFGEEDNPNVTYNMLESVFILDETQTFHNKKDFILLTEFRKQKIENIFGNI